MLTVKAMSDGDGYAANHLSNNDYYAEGEAVKGHWMSHGAELLGLEGEVDMKDFEAIREGHHPETGEFLRQRHSADRLTEKQVAGETVVLKSSARSLYDFTYSAPKDISIQALVDPRLVEDFRENAKVVAVEMERLAAARVRRLGANENRFTGNMVFSAWFHNTSRELDPQQHVHLVAGNLTFDGVETKWKALQASVIYEHRAYLTEFGRNDLAARVQARGYVIENHFKRGQDNGFGIRGIEETTRTKYSQRSAQKDAAIEQFIEKNGRLPSDNEVARLVRDTRPEKLHAITTAEVVANQLGRMTPEESARHPQLREAANDRGSLKQLVSSAASLDYASEHHFERLSVVKEHELLTAALMHGRGRIDPEDLKAELQIRIASGEILSSRGELATQQTLRRERQMVAAINQGIGQYEALGRGRAFVVSDGLVAEQKRAVQVILTSHDFATNMNGAAGAGKTTTLKELERGLREARRSLVVVAPSTSAVEVLRKDGFLRATTIARLLIDSRLQEELRGQVLVIDEAGMVGSQDMADLLTLAENKGARIVFSGDTAQIKSVSEGDALRILERESRLQGVSLREVQRQQNTEYRAAVVAFRTNPAEGYRQLEAMHAIREVNWLVRGEAVSQAYREAAAVLNRKGEERSVLVVAATHDEIKSITYAIRQDRKRPGELAEGQQLTQFTALNWTEAQKKQTQNYQAGQVLVFHKAVRGVAQKNEALEVVSGNRRHAVVQRADGKSVSISAQHAPAFGLFAQHTMEVAAGDKLLLQANWCEKTFQAHNGELVTVKNLEKGRIRLDDGRELPASYRQFTHGYAVTAHRSQAKTVDFEVICADHMSKDLFMWR